MDVASPNVTRWLLVDREGSVRDVIDNSAAVKDALAYDGFGIITSETNSANRGLLAYTASFTDTATGLQLHTYRWYDPARGGWQSPDPSASPPAIPIFTDTSATIRPMRSIRAGSIIFPFRGTVFIGSFKPPRPISSGTGTPRSPAFRLERSLASTTATSRGGNTTATPT